MKYSHKRTLMIITKNSTKYSIKHLQYYNRKCEKICIYFPGLFLYPFSIFVSSSFSIISQYYFVLIFFLIHSPPKFYLLFRDLHLCEEGHYLLSGKRWKNHLWDMPALSGIVTRWYTVFFFHSKLFYLLANHY